MTVFTESELREFWKNGQGKLPIFPAGTRFSASAMDFIRAQEIKILYDTNDNPSTNLIAGQPTNMGQGWDKPGAFPVVLTGPVPVCYECGQSLFTKPDHMTQIDAGHFGPKNSPRLIFRGRVDSLHSLVMLTASIARRFELPELALNLDTLAAYCREIMSAEYNLRPVSNLIMMGKNEEQLHDISHWPDKYLGVPHLVPGNYNHEILHWLNMLRSHSREVEIIALQAFSPTDSDRSGVGTSLVHALNRLSSAIYVLELYFQIGKLGWKVTE